MRIAVFDYKIIPTNPIGSCHLRMLEGLSREHQFVVFAVEFANPAPERIRFVRVPVPTRPLALLFIAFHLLAPIVYMLYRIRGGERIDLKQTVESNCALRGDIVYAHFCHRQFLKIHWAAVRTRGLRGILRWMDHFLHSLVEPLVYHRATHIVVPSHGLSRELSAEYPAAAGKIQVLANPVNLERMRMPGDFDRAAVRAQSGFSMNDTVLVFVALGHFERKGLPLILEALQAHLPENVKLHVIGGESDLVERYRGKVEQMGLGARVRFAGMQKNVAPFFWSADAFVLPSVYEVFPLVALEAAAAGIPMIVSPLNGVEEFLVDGANGFLIDRSASGVTQGIRKLLALSSDERAKLGKQAQADVRQYSVEQFQSRWRDVYHQCADGHGHAAAAVNS